MALVNEILAENAYNKVIAGVRNTDNKALSGIVSSHPKRVTVVKLDVDSEASVTEAAVTITHQFPGGIDYLFHNAGVHGSATYAGINSAFNTNTVGALRVVDAFLPLLKKGNKKVVLFVSSVAGNYNFQSAISQMGKILNNNMYGYRISKAALNFRMCGSIFANVAYSNIFHAVTDILARDLAEDGIKIISTHPGSVDTDMTKNAIGDRPNSEALRAGFITPECSAKILVEVCLNPLVTTVLTFNQFGVQVKTEDSGKFFNVEEKQLYSIPL